MNIEMSAPKFTPGPWLLDIRIGCIAIYSGAKENCLSGINKIAYWSGFSDDDGNWQTNDIDKANATLIAAAPDLYEAANNLLFLCNKYIPDHHWLNTAEKALKKARGEE
jgi:hypothetical protein